MAKFNDYVFGEEAKRDIDIQQQCALYLQACLSEEDYTNLKSAWQENGGAKKALWFEFIFQNVEVKYDKK